MADNKVQITIEVDGVKKVVNSVKDAQKAMQGLKKDTAEVAKENTIIGKGKKAFKDMTDGIKGATTGFKGLKGAIAATGIGALVIGLTTLVAFFKNSEEGSRKLAIAMEAIGIVFNKITQFATDLGKSLFDMFSNPKEALLNFGNLIKENIINRFEGLLNLLPSIGNAVSELFKGNFSKAATIAGNALGKVVLGVEDVVGKTIELGETVVETFDTIVAETKKAIVSATTLVDTFRQLRNIQQELVVDNALLNKELETQQKIAEDTTLTYNERKEALIKVGEAQVKLAENLQEQAAIEENLIKLQLKNEANYEAREALETELAEATAARIESETALELQKQDAAKITRELELEEVDRKRSINGMIEQLNSEAIQNEWERAREELRIAEETALAELTILKATEEEKQKIKDLFQGKRDKLGKEEAKFNKSLDEMGAKDKLDLANNAMGDIASIVGKNSQVGKAAAIAQTTMDTYASATSSYKSLSGIPVVGPVLGGIAAGAAVAAGLANIKGIVSTKTPGTGGGGGGGVAMPKVPQASSVNPLDALNTSLEGEEQENIVSLGQSSNSTGGTIRAYVVSDEMTSQQEADAKINDLARL